MNKLLITALLLAAVLPISAQTPRLSSPSGVEASGAPAASPSPSASVAKIDPEKERLIREVIARSKDAEMAQVRILQALESMKLAMPRVPEKFWDKYRQLISTDELQNRLVQVYDKHYTSDELNDLLKFYDSPVGKKMSTEAVPILRESMAIAQELSKQAAQSVASDVQAEQLLKQPQTLGTFRPQTLSPGNPTLSDTPTPSPTAAAP